MLLSPLPEQKLNGLVERLDGLLLSGGGDVDPDLFGELPHWDLGAVSPERDAFEIKLVLAMLEADKPVLGICRGIQLLNVALGGTLYQDLKSQYANSLQHQQQAPRCCPTHPVRMDAGSKLAYLSGSVQLRVNSLHHQAVRSVAPGLLAVAWAPDGVVEAVEETGGKYLLAVQWHPEVLWEEDGAAAALFRSFVEAAKMQER